MDAWQLPRKLDQQLDQQLPVRVCRLDFDHPWSCASSIVDITCRAVEAVTGVAANLTCLPTSILRDDPMAGWQPDGTMRDCDVVLGLETTFHAAYGLSTGVAYNSSPGLGVLVNPLPVTSVGGWAFLMPFSGAVWGVFAATALLAVAVQLLVAHGRAAPAAEGDDVLNTAAVAFAALLGSSRMSDGRPGDATGMLQVAASVAMALFSVFFTALYSSNLIAFFIPEQPATNLAQVDEARNFTVHWLYETTVRDDLGPRFESAGSTLAPSYVLRTTSAGAGAAGPRIADVLDTIAPSAVLWKHCTSGGWYLLGAGTQRRTVYSTAYTPGFPRDLAALIDNATAMAVSVDGMPWMPDACLPPRQPNNVDVRGVWGLFVAAAAAMAGTLVWKCYRVARANRTLFGAHFRWIGCPDADPAHGDDITTALPPPMAPAPSMAAIPPLIPPSQMSRALSEALSGEDLALDLPLASSQGLSGALSRALSGALSGVLSSVLPGPFPRHRVSRAPSENATPPSAGRPSAEWPLADCRRLAGRPSPFTSSASLSAGGNSAGVELSMASGLYATPEQAPARVAPAPEWHQPQPGLARPRTRSSSGLFSMQPLRTVRLPPIHSERTSLDGLLSAPSSAQRSSEKPSHMS